MIRVKHGMLFAGVAILMLGCKTQVIGGGSGGDGGGNDGTTSSGIIGSTGGSAGTGDVDGGPAPLPDDGPAIAMLFSESSPPDPSPGTGGVSTSAGGSTIDPNTLAIFLNSGAQSCLDPYTQPAGCVAGYHIGINLPPSLQAVGTYPLTNLAYFGFSEPAGGGVCSGGGGSYWDGTIEVTAIDATHVAFTLAGTGGIVSNPGNADGTYDAKRCF